MPVLIPADPWGSCPRSDTRASSMELGMSQEAGPAQIPWGGEKNPFGSSGRTGKGLGGVGILKDWMGEGGKSHPSSWVCTQGPALEVRGWNLGWDLFCLGFSQCKAQLRGHRGLFLLGLLLGSSWEAAWAGALLGDGTDQRDFVPFPSQSLFFWEWLIRYMSFALFLFVISP